MSPALFEASQTKFSIGNALFMAEASELAYGDQASIFKKVKNEWGFPKVQFLESENTQVFVAADSQAVVCAFRGTESDQSEDWMTDANLKFAPGPLNSKCHRGFTSALKHVWKDLRKVLEDFRDASQNIWFTGHSLGGAVAMLAAATQLDEEKPVAGLYTFGQPRAGDRGFAIRFDALLGDRTFRFVNQQDIVTRVPPRVLNYNHAGTACYFDSKDKLHLGMTGWRIFLDSVKEEAVTAMTRFYSLADRFPDWVSDHSMTRYLSKIKKATGV